MTPGTRTPIDTVFRDPCLLVGQPDRPTTRFDSDRDPETDPGPTRTTRVCPSGQVLVRTPSTPSATVTTSRHGSPWVLRSEEDRAGEGATHRNPSREGERPGVPRVDILFPFVSYRRLRTDLTEGKGFREGPQVRQGGGHSPRSGSETGDDRG